MVLTYTMQCMCTERNGKVVSLCGAHAAAVREATQRERDACAKAVENIAWSSPSADTEYAMREVARVAAFEIRKRN